MKSYRSENANPVVDTRDSDVDKAGSPPYAPQVELPDFEKNHLVNRICADHTSAQSEHKRRLAKFARFQDRWRIQEGTSGGSRGKSNFAVPLTKSQILISWAKLVEQMLGDDAEIVARPQGPSDQKRVHKIGRYMSWRLFTAMNAANDLIEFGFNQLLYGRAVAYSPYEQEYVEDENGAMVIDYEGPGFHVIPPDDLIVPGETVKSIQDFSFVIRRYDQTLNELLDGEEAGIYKGIEKNFEELYQSARGSNDRSSHTTQESSVEDVQRQSEGIEPGWGQNYSEKLEVWEWYGYWRMLAKPDGESRPDAETLTGRDVRQSEIVVRIIPALNMLIGCQLLRQLYPNKKARRPFVEIALMKDGSYWCPSIAELVESMEEELTQNHNLGTEAIERTIGPLIFYVPGTGFEPETFKYEPATAVPMSDPNSIKVVNLSANISGMVEREQTTFRWVERTTGRTDLQAGRASDRPNAPRTARQTVALLEESNIRVMLDMTVLRNDLADALKHIWEIDTMYGSEQVFFRVTEEQAKGLFETSEGGAYITHAERAGKYDFQLRFATSVYSREARKADALALYQLNLSNPLVINDPHALWVVTNAVHRALGDDNFAAIVPEPPETVMPHMPDQEWNALLEGEDIHVHPQDNDDQHIYEHNLMIAAEMAEPEERQDKKAIIKGLIHIAEHEEQKLNKQRAAGQMAGLADIIKQLSGQQGDIVNNLLTTGTEGEQMSQPAAPDLSTGMADHAMAGGAEMQGAY